MARSRRSVLSGAAMVSAVALVVATASACQKRASKADEAAAAAGGGPSAPAQSAEAPRTPLAKVGSGTNTLGELQDKLNRQSPYIRARYTSLEQKKEFLDSLIRFEVLAKEAAKRGYDKDPEVLRTMKQVMIQKLMKEEFETRLTPESIPD